MSMPLKNIITSLSDVFLFMFCPVLGPDVSCTSWNEAWEPLLRLGSYHTTYPRQAPGIRNEHSALQRRRQERMTDW